MCRARVCIELVPFLLVPAVLLVYIHPVAMLLCCYYAVVLYCYTTAICDTVPVYVDIPVCDAYGSIRHGMALLGLYDIYHLFVRSYVRTFIRLFVCSASHPTHIYTHFCVCVCLSIRLRLSMSMSVYLSVYVSVESTCLSVYPCNIRQHRWAR